MLPKIYIVTPCLNASSTIDATIESVVSQSGEFLLYYHIQDGGSVDGTKEKLSKWKQHLNSSPHYSHITFSCASENDRGVYDAILKGFEKLNASSDSFLGWINADDILFPGTLSIVAKTAVLYSEVQWICGVPTVIDMQGKIIAEGPGYCLPRSFIARGVCDGLHWTGFQQEGTFFRKCLWDAVGGLNLSFKLAGDWDLWRRMAVHAHVAHVSRALGAFRRRPGQLSAVQADLYKREMDTTVSIRERKISMRELARATSISVPVIDCGEGHIVMRDENRLSTFKQRVYLWLSGNGLYSAIRLYRQLRSIPHFKRVIAHFFSK